MQTKKPQPSGTARLDRAMGTVKAPALRPDPLTYYELCHDRHLRMCDRLEAIADSLPKAVNRLSCLAAIEQLQMVRQVHSEFESGLLFPLMRTSIGDERGLLATLDHLDSQHIEDDSYAIEVCEALDALSRGASISDSETLAYMLRGYFEGLRRHIALERSVVLPLARERLGSDDLQKLEDSIVAKGGLCATVASVA